MRAVFFIIVLFANFIFAQDSVSDSLLVNEKVKESKLIKSVVDSIVVKYKLDPNKWSLSAKKFRGFVSKSGYIHTYYKDLNVDTAKVKQYIKIDFYYNCGEYYLDEKGIMQNTYPKEIPWSWIIITDISLSKIVEIPF